MQDARADTSAFLKGLFGLEGQVAVITGGTGVLGGAMARGLAHAGAKVGILGRREEKAEGVATAIQEAGGEAIPLPADVLRKEQLQAARDALLGRWGRVDILVNAAGGNVPAATLAPGASFWELPEAAFREVFDLNLLGTVLPSQVFGQAMAENGAQDSSGSIVNISSATAARAVSRVVGYSAAKAAVENFTQWLGVQLAREHGDRLRVNAIAPGWFIAEQNRAVMLDPDGSPSARGRTVLAHSPTGRFGEPDELVGTVIWLCGPGARFVNGAVIPVDGGFGAWTGV